MLPDNDPSYSNVATVKRFSGWRDLLSVNYCITEWTRFAYKHFCKVMAARHFKRLNNKLNRIVNNKLNSRTCDEEGKERSIVTYHHGTNCARRFLWDTRMLLLFLSRRGKNTTV